MTYNAHSDDQPPAQWRRFTADDEAEAVLPVASLQDPVAVGMMFVNALGNHREYFNALQRFVTPESLPAFGDFTEAANFLASIEDFGCGTIADRAYGDEDVAYFKILRGVPDSYQVLDAQPIMAAAVLTMVWRRQFGEWRVHSIGPALRPEEVPH